MKRLSIVTTLLALIFVPTQLQAQDTTSSVDAELRAMVVDADASENDRDVLADFLSRPDVQQAAADRGIDIERLREGVATLDRAASADLADRVRDAEEPLVGGDTYVISGTTIIIILLILILVT